MLTRNNGLPSVCSCTTRANSAGAVSVGPTDLKVRRHGGFREWPEPEVLTARVHAQVLMHRAQRMAVHGHLDRAIGADEQQAGGITALRQRGDEIEGRVVAPV